MFDEQSPLGKEITVKHAKKIQQLRLSITTDITKLKKWNDNLGVIRSAAA